MKPTRAILRCVILMLLVSLGISMVSAWSYNRYLEDNFVPNGKKWPMFEQGMPIEEIYKSYQEHDQYAFSTLTLHEIEITLKQPIRYYETPDVKSEPALELPAGRYRIAIGEPVFDQGLNTLPTYRKGWRYARTLPSPISDENENTIPISSFNRWYYVQLQDLNTVRIRLLLEGESKYFWRWVTKINLNLTSPIEYWNSLWRETDLFNLDEILYENGDYLSPDLFRPLWDWKCAALVIGIVLLMVPERLSARRENTT